MEHVYIGRMQSDIRPPQLKKNNICETKLHLSSLVLGWGHTFLCIIIIFFGSKEKLSISTWTLYDTILCVKKTQNIQNHIAFLEWWIDRKASNNS